jgi:hypothetical protein
VHVKVPAGHGVGRCRGSFAYPPTLAISVLVQRLKGPHGLCHVTHPRFHAHLVTCDRCAFRRGVQRSSRLSFCGWALAEAVHQPAMYNLRRIQA